MKFKLLVFKRQCQENEKTNHRLIFAKDIFDKELCIFKTYREPLQFNSKKINNTIENWVKDFNWYLTQGDIQMTNEQVKWHSTSYFIRRMQIKTTMTLLHTYQDIAKTKSWWGYGAIGGPNHFQWECKVVQWIGRELGSFLQS